jgi:hypothetical protein
LFLLVVALLVLCTSPAVLARDYELTPFLGLSFDTTEYDDVAPSYGLVFGIPLSDSAGLELLLSRQETEARVVDPALFAPAYESSADVDHLLFGGTYRGGSSQQTSRGFVNFSIGVARVNPPEGLDDSYSLSIAAGGGVQLRAGRRTRARLQASWISTNGGSGSLSCSSNGSCKISSDSLIGGIELSAGLTVAF